MLLIKNVHVFAPEDLGLTDILVAGGKIELIKPHIELSADIATIVDGKGQMAAPGFIDPHSHSDRTIPYDSKVQATIRQGITTLVIGQCGFTPAPVNPDREDLLKKRLSHAIPPGTDFPITWQTFGEYLTVCEQTGCASNVATLVGFMAIRIAAMGYDDREPTSDELSQMKAYVKEAMQAGAFGMSTGLPFTPQSYAQID